MAIRQRSQEPPLPTGVAKEILESIREQESLQAVDRLRLIHATKPKTIYLLCNLPLPGLPPDELVALDDLLLPGRIAEVMLRDFAVAGPKALAARHPDLFPTVKTAQHVMDDFAAGLNTPFPYIGSYRQKGYLNIATYRTSGTAGNRAAPCFPSTCRPRWLPGYWQKFTACRLRFWKSRRELPRRLTGCRPT